MICEHTASVAVHCCCVMSVTLYEMTQLHRMSCMYDTAVHVTYSAMHLLWMRCRLHVHVCVNASSCCSDMYRRDWMQYGCCMCVCLQMDMLTTDSVYFVFCCLYVELCLCLGVCCIVFVVVWHVCVRACVACNGVCCGVCMRT
jgi:hypothetical protein